MRFSISGKSLNCHPEKCIYFTSTKSQDRQKMETVKADSLPSLNSEINQIYIFLHVINL